MSTRGYPSGGRFFSSTINVEKSHPTFNNIYDQTATWTAPNGTIYTGGWRPLTPQDLTAEINVSGGLSVNLGPLNITGVVNTVIGNTPDVFLTNPSVQITGQPVFTTGTSNVTVLNGILPISGNININGNQSLSVGITGGTLNVALTGNNPVNFTGNVVASYPSSTTVSNSTPSGAFGTILPANPNRKSWYVQNNSTGDNYLKFGTAATSQSYNIFLQGNHASFLDDGARYKGSVSLTGDTAANYIVWELT